MPRLSQITEAIECFKKLEGVVKHENAAIGKKLGDCIAYLEENIDHIWDQVDEDEPLAPLLKLKDIPEDINVLVATGGMIVDIAQSRVTYTGYRNEQDAQEDVNGIEIATIEPPLLPWTYVQLQELYDLDLQAAVYEGDIKVYIPNINDPGDFEPLEPGGLYNVAQERAKSNRWR